MHDHICSDHSTTHPFTNPCHENFIYKPGIVFLNAAVCETQFLYSGASLAVVGCLLTAEGPFLSGRREAGTHLKEWRRWCAGACRSCARRRMAWRRRRCSWWP